LSNRGVTGLGIDLLDLYSTVGFFVGVDWLRYSSAWPGGVIPLPGERYNCLRRAVYPSSLIAFTGEILRNPKGYDTCLGLNCGSVRYHSQMPEQKIGVEHTGKDMNELRTLGITATDVLAYIRLIDGKVSRIDLALDVLGQVADPMDIARAFEADELLTEARTMLPMDGKIRGADGLKSAGATVYIGSRSSERFLRVYDKAAEQGLPALKWTRIELVLGGEVAAAYAPLITEDTLGQLVRSAIKRFCEAPTVPWYVGALAGQLMPLPALPRKDPNRKRWLLDQVLPAYRAELADGAALGDWELFDAYQAAAATLMTARGLSAVARSAQKNGKT